MLTLGVYWWDPWHTIYSSTMDPSWVRISCWSIFQLHPLHPIKTNKNHPRSRSWWASIPKSPKISRRSSTRISLSRAWHQCLGIGFSRKFGDFPGHKPWFGVGFSTFHGGFSTFHGGFSHFMVDFPHFMVDFPHFMVDFPHFMVDPHWNLQRSSNRLRFGWQSMAIQRCFCGRWSLRWKIVSWDHSQYM